MSLIPIPPELWATIFSYACTDPGRTGCSLSLVCRSFRDILVAASVDIQTVQLCGEPAMQSFLRLLQSRERRKRRVRYLLVTNSYGRDRLKRPRPNGDHASPTAGISEEKSRSLPQLLKRILHIIDHHALLSLCLFIIPYGVPISHTSLFAEPFPSLTTLVLSGPISPPFFTRFVPAPKLKRIHIARHSGLPDDLDTIIATIAPNLEYLTLSGVRELSDMGNLPSVLRHFIRHPPTTPSPTHSIDISSPILASPISPNGNTHRRSSFPPSLKNITIRFRPYYGAHWQNGGQARYERAVDELRQVAAAVAVQQHRGGATGARLTEPRISIVFSMGYRNDELMKQDEEARYRDTIVEWLNTI